MGDTDQTKKKPEPVIPIGPITACIAAAQHRLSVSKCGRSVEKEFIFTDADYAVGAYDRAVRNIPPTALAACPDCIKVRRREVEEDSTSRAK
jgi:hypothetical protein